MQVALGCGGGLRCEKIRIFHSNIRNSPSACKFPERCVRDLENKIHNILCIDTEAKLLIDRMVCFILRIYCHMYFLGIIVHDGPKNSS